MSEKIAGHVFNKDRRPVAKAKILLKGKVVAESRKDGFFSVALAKADPRVALTFVAEGYVSNTRIFDSRAAGINVVVIWPISYRVKFDPNRELDVELESSRIQVPANALAGREGEKNKGPATLQFTWFNVMSPLQRAAAPGDFSGQLLDRSIRRLNSYGIFDFDFQDSKGQSLELRRGAKIELAIAVPPRLAREAPKQTGFFSFDTVAGLWIQLGSFTFAQDTFTYNGSVTSFGGAYNFDVPQDTTCVTVQVVNDWDSAPLPNFNVTAHGKQYDSHGITDANGYVCLVVQRNASFSAEALGSFGGSDYGTLGPIPAFTAPDISSDANDCGNSTMCPFVGTIYATLVPHTLAPLGDPIAIWR
jgi:hypothetical protein